MALDELLPRQRRPEVGVAGSHKRQDRASALTGYPPVTPSPALADRILRDDLEAGDTAVLEIRGGEIAVRVVRVGTETAAEQARGRGSLRARVLELWRWAGNGGWAILPPR